MYRYLSAIAILVIAPSAPLTAVAQETVQTGQDTIQLSDWLDFEGVADPQISPDGRTILYTRSRVDTLNDQMASSIWMMNADGSNKRQLMTGGGAQWSPDGSRILFVDADANDKPQLFLRSSDGLITQITHMPFAPRSMKWAPDGKSIAFVARVPQKEEWTITLPARPEGAQWSPDPVIVDTLHYRQDRVGITNDGYDHIFVVPATGGTPRQLTTGEWNVGARRLGVIAGAPALDWSPDSQLISFDGSGKPYDQREWWLSQINTVDVRTKEIRTLTSGKPSFNQPLFSPDGESLAFLGYEIHDKLTPIGDIWLMNMNSGEKRRLTSDLPDTPQSLRFTADGRDLMFTLPKAGSHNLHVINRAGAIRNVTSGDQVVSLGSASRSDAVAVTVSNGQLPTAIAMLPDLRSRSSLTPLTDVNADIFAGKRFGKVEEIWYDSTAANGDTARVQGWIVYPPDYREGESYPMVLSIHGGPQAMSTNAFSFRFQEFAARGYVVLYTNPRGSTGYGEAFTNSINGQYPGQFDYADLMAGVDTVLAKGIADPDRLFVMGCSGGGVLTTHVISQTNRFKAAAALCPVTNWIGMSGGTDVSGWLYSFFEKPFWEDPAPWIENSTVMHVGKVETPTLLMTGIKDIRTPIGEAEQYYTALKMRGIPAKLIPMPNEYHGTSSKPSNFLRTHLYLQKWFEQYDPAHAGDEDTEK